MYSRQNAQRREFWPKDSSNIHECTHVCVHAHAYVLTCVCTCVCVCDYTYVHVCMYALARARACAVGAHVRACMYVCMCVCLCTCVHAIAARGCIPACVNSCVRAGMSACLPRRWQDQSPPTSPTWGSPVLMWIYMSTHMPFNSCIYTHPYTCYTHVYTDV